LGLGFIKERGLKQQMMKHFFVAIAFLLLGSITAIAQDTPDSGDFDGRWEGTMKYLSPETYDQAHGFVPSNTEFAFSIDGKTAKVFYKLETGEWHEAKQGAFVFIPYKTNAVILSMTSDATRTNPGDWVETWNFTLTHKDKDSLYVIFSRAVNNFRHPPDFDDGKFKGRYFVIAYSEFKRISVQPNSGARPYKSPE
jgi:hypothetical protein